MRAFQLHLIESGASICNRNRIMTGVRFLFRVTLRRHDLAAEVYHIKEPQKLPPTRYDAGVPPQERWLFPGRRKGLHLTTRQLSRLFHGTIQPRPRQPKNLRLIASVIRLHSA